jgi:hypothetical protein
MLILVNHLTSIQMPLTPSLVLLLAKKNGLLPFSRKLDSAQRDNTTVETEILSVVETLQQYRHIILGNTCCFFCDHKNLGFHDFKSKRVRRWRSTL